MPEPDPEGCKRCGHLIGYHWDGGDEMWCTAKDCTCRGYVDPGTKYRFPFPKDPELPSQ